MSLQLTFQITLQSDYHISAGHGLGAAIDSALLRDEDGVPVLRGTTLVGLLRDSLWRLLQLDAMQANHPPICKASGLTGKKVPDYCRPANTNSDPLCPVCRLMGNPRHPKHWHVSSARPLGLETVGVTGWEAGQTGAQVTQRARISPRTRRAEPRKLFSQEEGAAALTFRFTISTQLAAPYVLDEAALWVAVARNVRQLGRSRRRGQGECLITLTGVQDSSQTIPDDKAQEWLLGHFRERWLEGTPTPITQPERDTLPSIAAATTDETPYRLRLVVRTDEPVIIARRAEAGNQFDTLNIITGQVLRGALAWRAVWRFNLSEKDGEAYRQFTRLFLRGDVAFPMLYPTCKYGSRQYPTIPAPLNWLTCKTLPGLPETGHGMYGGLESPQQKQCPTCESPLQPLNDFITVSNKEGFWKGSHFKITPKKRSELHVAIAPETNRANEGDLFSYAALEAGQYFIGELRCRNKATWDILQKLTGVAEDEKVVLRLGKATRRGYGRCTLWFTAMTENDPLTLIQQPLDAQRVPSPDKVTLTLLSDTIVTDRWGRFMDSFNSHWLSEQLNGLVVEIETDSIAAKSQQVDGFNAHLGLPRWRDLALKAGSAVRFKLTNPPDNWREILAEVEQDGIGLRRNEGFGLVAFNHPVYIQCQNIVRDRYDKLPGYMQPRADNQQQHPSFEKDDFVKQWLESLDEQTRWKENCSHDYFTAVARWLNMQVNTSPNELARKLDNLGKLDDDLIRAIGPDEYSDREAQDKLQKEYGEGLKLIKRQLKALSGEDQTHWPLGIQLLAEHVADSVEKKGDNL